MEIRNFVIISHIDHGKSTLADRLLELTGTVDTRHMKAQYLDSLELERERGITIKMAPVRMIYHANRRSAQNETQNNAEEFLYSDLTYKIRGAIFSVRKNLGLGHKEQVYHNALEIEFKNVGLKFESKKNIPIKYEGQNIGVYQPDFIIEDKIIIELKALPEIGRPQIEQLWSYLKGCDYKLALLVNFGSGDLEIKRIIYDKARLLRDSASSLRQSAQVEDYILNLIDTPGHSDFAYEVSRALSAVEGAILLVDAASGIQAQTLANFESAQKANLKIIGAVNKIDVASPEQIESAISELSRLLNVKPEEIFKISGKTGEGVRELLETIIMKIPAPQTYAERTQKNAENILRSSALSLRESAINARALIFDSLYDEHKGVIAFVRVFNGSFKAGDDTKLLSNNKQFKIKEVGYFVPELKKQEILNEGEIGYIATGLKDPDSVKVGDTIGEKALAGFKTPQPVVFVSLYPEEGDDYDNLKTALNKLRLNDSSFSIFPTTSEALGRGFQAGFLGKLHFEIVVQRLEREFGIKTINSFPSVSYKIMQKQGEWAVIENPKDFPDDYIKVLEPITAIKIIVPLVKLGDVLKLKNSFRLSQMETEINGEKAVVSANLPLADLVSDFDDQLKSVSSGFASFSYNVVDYRETQVRRLDIKIAGGVAHGLSRIIPEKDVEAISRKMVEKLKELLPRKQFTQAIQAMVGGRIIARETITALKKDVAGYLYGGDRSRKMKLWKKQKRGKKKLLKMAEGVEIPVKIFKDLLK